MKRFSALNSVGFVVVLLTLFVVKPLSAETSTPLRFVYENGRPIPNSQNGLRGQSADLPAVSKQVHAYATFDMGTTNPIRFSKGRPAWKSEKKQAKIKASAEPAPSDTFFIQPKPLVARPNNQPQNLQVLTFGEMVGKKFTPAIRIGLADDGRAETGKAHVTPWINNGRFDRFSNYARPNTPYDFKLTLDLEKKQLTAWVSGRGDDDWFLIAENVRLINKVKSINHAQVLQFPDSPAIHNVRISATSITRAEAVQPHPLAKKERTVLPDRGFRFQPMRSTWRKPGKHVTIFRRVGVHAGFPDVAQAGEKHLVCVWRNGSHTGGNLETRIAHSYDNGQTWSNPARVYTTDRKMISGNCPRLQRLKNGNLLLVVDLKKGGSQFVAEHNVGMYESSDGGKTWRDERWLVPSEAGGGTGIVPSHITELPDGRWLLAASSFPKLPGGWTLEKAELFYSPDRGHSWVNAPPPHIFPPYTPNEPSPVLLDDGRLVVYARESRPDGMPGGKYTSSDNGKTWSFQELPHPITGRTCAKLLKDGRIMLTYRSGIGRAALRAWIGDPNDPTTAQPAGGHFNDHQSVALKDGALHIDNDGHRGQFTKYNLRPPDTKNTVIDITAELKVLENQGRAATLTVPFAGKIRFFPDHFELAHNSSLRVNVSSGEFHTYRIISRVGRLQIEVDGKIALDTDKADSRLERLRMAEKSIYSFGFGNEARGVGAAHLETPSTMPDVYTANITPEVTGYSLWRRVEVLLNDPESGKRSFSWQAARDGFPDQYQLDHIIEIEASAAGHDQGYSGWTQLDDGRIFVVHYTDDGSAVSRPNRHNFGAPWIRGTFLELADLPPVTKQ